MTSSAMKSSPTCLVLKRNRKWNSHKNKNTTQQKKHQKQMTWKRDREKENQTWICARSSCIRFQLSAYCRLPFEKVTFVTIVIFVAFVTFVTFVTFVNFVSFVTFVIFVTFVTSSLNVSVWKKPQYQWSGTIVSGSERPEARNMRTYKSVDFFVQQLITTNPFLTNSNLINCIIKTLSSI